MGNKIKFIAVLVFAAFGSSQAFAMCQMPKPTEINVIPRTDDVKYDLSQPRAELQKYDIDTINPYGFGADTHTNGFMRGRISLQPQVAMDYKFILENQAVCIWYDKIDLDISISPEIVIAKEVADDPCQFRVTKQHELKHVMADRKIVNKYAKSIGRKVFDGLKSRGFMVGPVKADVAQQVVNRMQETVIQLVELEYKKMEIERAERQQEIDSLEEYERVKNACEQRAIGASRR